MGRASKSMKTSSPLGLLLLLPALVVARPSYIDCDLKTTLSIYDIMTTDSQMMGYAPSTDAGIITIQSATTFTAGSAVTFILEGVKAAKGVMHATAGSVSGFGYSPKTGCAGTNVMMVDNRNGVASDGTATTERTVEWFAPADVSGISSVTISFVIGQGQGQIYRTSRTLTKDSSSEPSGTPSSMPSRTPSSAPSIAQTDEPSSTPSTQPSNAPSDEPSSQPSTQPSNTPIDEPSSIPSLIPSDEPSSIPSKQPSLIQTDEPSSTPSTQPSSIPTRIQTGEPSSTPSTQPSNAPSDDESSSPSTQPS